MFTREEVIKYTEPKLGYTKESPGFLRFANVLVEMTGAERKAFLQFTTGCSSLPPGGLANLHPRLKTHLIPYFFPSIFIPVASSGSPSCARLTLETEASHRSTPASTISR